MHGMVIGLHAPEDPFRLRHSRALWFVVSALPSLRLTGGLMEQQMGTRERGRACYPPPPPNQPRVCSYTPTTWSFHGCWQDSLCQWETVLLSSLPGTAKASGPPQGLAGLPPASQEVAARQADWRSPRRLLTLTASLHPTLPAGLPGPIRPFGTPALGVGTPFSCPAAHALALSYSLELLQLNPFGLHKL